MAKKVKTLYQFYVELDGFKPKIWRRFQVASDIQLTKLGYILMVLFEMKAEHLFMITVPKRENMKQRLKSILTKEEALEIKDESFNDLPSHCIFELQFDDMDEPLFEHEDEQRLDILDFKVKDVIETAKSALSFEYDFGDGWQLSLVLEKVITEHNISAKDLPHLLDGQGYGIVENCGGVHGLSHLVKVFKKKTGEEYEDLSEWLGIDDFDINHFDLDDLNFRIKKIPRIYRQSYEDDLMPTQQSIDLIERRYLKK